MTPETAIVYSRDQLLTLQNHAALLNHGQCSRISQLCLRRRGCRAGAHLRRRLWTANQAASSAGDYNQISEVQLRSYPLTQLVKTPTRGTATLDKIFTNLKSWYQSPVVLPAVGSSDHNTVLLHPVLSPSRPQRVKRTTYRRSSDPNGKAMIYYHLKNFNWTSLYYLDSCQTMTQYFYLVVLSLLDQYLPFVRCCTFSCDKPWVTPEFRQLIKRRQRAFLSGQFPLYRKLRNQTKRMAASLRKKYFERRIESLHSLDPHTWWTKIKNFLQFSDSNPLQSLQDSHSDAGLPITELINNFFVGISADLPELDINMLSDLADDYNTDFVIDPSEVEHRLAKINNTRLPARMASRIGFSVISANYYATHLQPFLMHLLERDSFL